MIDRNHWQRLSALLDEALALEGAAREAWLAALRAREPALADELGPMLAQAGDEAATLPGVDDFAGGLDAALQQPAAAAAAPGAPQPGLQFGPWQLLHKIGEGGMGQVWLARRADGLYEAQAAIKLLRSDLHTSALQARFARERAVLARLNHPAVARLLDAGIADRDADGGAGGQAYLVLEYVDGRPLADYVRHAGLGLTERVRLMLQIAEAVDHAHAQLIVHRDLKPSNVIVRHDGQAKLLDFGIAGLLDDGVEADTELTRQTGRGLTIGYAAPEQILGEPIGTAADVFSLGVMLYELLSGTLPFAPRRSPRLAAERAVLHDEPARLSALARGGPPSADDAEQGPGRPADIARVAGDLEAIVAKALRKNLAERYGSVRALMDDLSAWLGHRPVSARREDWRHRTRLWMRRNAVLAAAMALVGISLSVGLAAATWQWKRAERAARQSDQVTEYLTELLASADPEKHGGQWPTVMQLLEESRKTLPGQFQDDPETRMRLLTVLGDTYHELNRFDLSVPLYDELLALSEKVNGPDAPFTLEVHLYRARSLQVQGLFDKAIAELEPVMAKLERAFGRGSHNHRISLYVLNASYARAGRLEDADRVLAEAGRVTEAQFPPGSPERLSHLNHVQVLRVGQGRLQEGLAALKQTEPWWNEPAVKKSKLGLVLQRNTLAVQLRLSIYDRVEERAAKLLAECDQMLGPGNDLASGLRHELARYHTEVGQFTQALAQREENLEQARAAGVESASVLLPLRVQVLLAQAQAHVADADALRRETRSMLAELDRERDTVGYARAEAWINLMRVGLALDDAALAAEALAPLKSDAGLDLARNGLLASRVTQLEGELARLQGDLPRSRALLKERMARFERATDRQVLPAWVAAVDLAFTEVLAGGPEAAAALAAADARRPPAMPAGHPLDLAMAWLRARHAAGSDDAPAVREALAALQRQQGRRAGQPAGPGLGAFGGSLI